MAKALVMMSGGLDSILAAKVLMEQGIQVEAVTFTAPFFDSENGEKAAAALGIPIHIIDFTDEHLQMLKEPKHGYGRFMNPCIDCHAMMFRAAGKLMRELGADFIATGEVLGERPKSQNSQALGIVEREAGLEGYLLRPLSAKLLPPTIPEQSGLVDRERLLAIQGRSRKPQMDLAARYGITEYPTPAGGCLLTDPIYALRLKALYAHEGVPSRNHVELIKLGRLFKASDGSIILVSRNEEENNKLTSLLLPDDTVFEVEDYAGPLVVVLNGSTCEGTDREAAALAVRYGKAKTATEATIEKRSAAGGASSQIHMVRPLEHVTITPAQDSALGEVRWQD